MRSKFVFVAALAILLAVSFLGGALATGDHPVNAQDATTTAAEPAAPSDTSTRSCTIGHIAVLDNRIHVYCQFLPPPVPTVFFAYPLTTAAESRQANRFLAVLNTAYALGRPVSVTWDNLSSHNPPGCLAADCRRLVGLVIAP